MSSADSSPGTYLGNLAAGKMANNEMLAIIEHDAASDRVSPSPWCRDGAAHSCLRQRPAPAEAGAARHFRGEGVCEGWGLSEPFVRRGEAGGLGGAGETGA